jgi:hypothetical protein
MIGWYYLEESCPGGDGVAGVADSCDPAGYEEFILNQKII